MGSGSDRRVTAFILCDVALHRDGLAGLLLEEPYVDVVGLAAPGPTTLARIRTLLPRIVLLDLAPPARYAEASAVREAAPDARIVAIGVMEIDHEIICCAEAGVSGYVTPESTISDLRATVASISRDEFSCSPRMAATLMRHLGSPTGSPSALLAQLTVREREVVGLVARGLTNKEIGLELGIRMATVKTHVHHLLVKLQLRRRSELAALYGVQPNRFDSPAGR